MMMMIAWVLSSVCVICLSAMLRLVCVGYWWWWWEEWSGSRCRWWKPGPL